MSNSPRFRLSPPRIKEHPLQAQIAKVLTIELAPPGKRSAHGVVWFSIDHSNYAGQVPGVRISRGIIAGIPDTFIIHRGRTHLIEIKAEDGELSDEQRSVISAARLCGCPVGICGGTYAADEVLACLDTWKIPRKGLVHLDQRPMRVSGGIA